MNYLLDTCLISELAKSEPNKNVADWIMRENETSLYVSVLTFGELHEGIEKLPESTKKEELHNWVENELKDRFQFEPLTPERYWFLAMRTAVRLSEHQEQNHGAR